MAFGAHDVEAARVDDLPVAFVPFLLQHPALALVHVLQAGQLRLEIAPEHDVGAAAGHVGGDGDGSRAPRVHDDLGFPSVVLGVQDLVRDALAAEQPRDVLGGLDGSGAHQHRLAPGPAVVDVRDDGLELLFLRQVDDVGVVVADHGLVGGDHHHLEPVDLLELGRLGVGGAGHAGELVVETEVVLKRDRGERLVLVLDRHAFLCFHRLVQSLRPPPPRHGPARELVDDHHFAPLGDDVLHVAAEERVRPQSRVDMVHQHDVGRVVEALARREQPLLDQQVLDLLVAVFGEKDLLRLLVHAEVAGAVLFFLPRQKGNQPVDPDVELGVLVGGAGDDERCPGLVDEDGVDLVHYREAERALHLVGGAEGHVVAEVVEPELVVGAVDDIGGVGLALLRGGLAGHDHSGAQPEESVDRPHPLRVAPGEVVVHGDDVHALPVQRIEVGGKRGDQGLALPGAHLRDVAFVQGDSANELDVEVAHVQRATRDLANDREGFGDDLLEGLALLPSPAQRPGLSLQGLVGERADFALQRVDPGDRPAHAAQLAVVSAPDDPLDYLVEH